MSDKLDPKELKILADILALVLEDHPGQSANALDAIRNRARRNGTTGGALKNLFTALAPNPPARPPPRPRASRAASGAAAEEMQAARTRILQLTESINRLDLDLRSARARNEELRSQLYLTQQARAETQAALSVMRARPAQRRRSVVALAFAVGALVGAIGMGMVRAMDVPAVPFRTTALN
ncbi:hypothetical protein HLH26_01195 [Gluconacetobacter sp. 1b LMG 1731]|uniref:Uncharacterized protein n=1 Tax=Gluconacetobacter dulcium TaxID=2729096 RepID=A0A7W4NR24_9PROT|nr:hypothetical protein [Gluconacetobacter dulcium]MBB2163166.1 hypothetical protein [Gluconacetobacter dulcium]MBB2192139.1 hypothetical protein [Gluconacetobacter dulcium]MBB2197541.1 hypothetical protein [Gluconacetobacter dulcium]